MSSTAGEMHVCFGSWLCENAKMVESDRRSCSSKADLALMRATDFKPDGTQF